MAAFFIYPRRTRTHAQSVAGPRLGQQHVTSEERTVDVAIFAGCAKRWSPFGSRPATFRPFGAQVIASRPVRCGGAHGARR
jgi:hypothetical protein